MVLLKLYSYEIVRKNKRRKMKKKDICERIRELPTDIILYIRPFTYCIQSQELQEDIYSFVQSERMISNIYYHKWFFLNYGENNDREWLINDIFRFCNEDKATMFGYVDKFYRICRRHRLLENVSKDRIDDFIQTLENKHVNNQIYFFWGLFTPMERDFFIGIHATFDV